MSFLLGMLAASLLQSDTPQPARGWVWTLYNTGGPVVLADEIPDTPHLRTTLECVAGSSQIKLTRYQSGIVPPPTGSRTLTATAGQARQEIAAFSLDEDRLTLTLPVNAPVARAMLATGALELRLENQTSRIGFDRSGRQSLLRFAQVCTG